ncbi:hypothetical protein [Larkinella rosea]|uniref:hypothetical protein n=1 Tax=Larkinella rosea TaxID=2025312 RepID=UPI001639863D|nr:hypothetical protein [Larkinella rosea]
MGDFARLCEAIIHPHPISGPLDIHQRFAFLRFHIDRHRNQVTDLRTMLAVWSNRFS